MGNEWTTSEPYEPGHYWWRWKGQEKAQGIAEYMKVNGDYYWAFSGFLAHENGQPVSREFWPVRIEEPHP